MGALQLRAEALRKMSAGLHARGEQLRHQSRLILCRSAAGVLRSKDLITVSHFQLYAHSGRRSVAVPQPVRLRLIA